MRHICPTGNFTLQVDNGISILELDLHLIRWRSPGKEPAEKLRFAAAAGAGLERIGLIRISIARRMESPDGTYMSHYGAPVGCQGAPCGSAAGPVFSRDLFPPTLGSNPIPKSPPRNELERPIRLIT